MGKYVALLDILGFSEIVSKNSHQDIVDLFDRFIIYVQMSIANYKSMEDQHGRTVFDLRNSVINSTIISDSIIFWTNDESTSDFFELVEITHRFLTFCHSLPFIFLRGSITFGDFHYNYPDVIRGKGSTMVHTLMVGKALVTAYQNEKKLEIAGCIINNDAINTARNYNQSIFNYKWNEFLFTNKLVEYEMPLKHGLTEKYWTLNWVKETTDHTFQELIDGFSSFNKNVEAKEVKSKIENTLNYYLTIKKEIFNQSSDSFSSDSSA